MLKPVHDHSSDSKQTVFIFNNNNNNNNNHNHNHNDNDPAPLVFALFVDQVLSVSVALQRVIDEVLGWYM